MSMGARDKRPESLLGKEQSEGSQAMSVPERAFPAWTRATAADVWGWWETSWEPRESPSPLLQESPEETPRKRRGRSARAPAVGWALPPAGASEECRGPHGSPRCLRPSSGETLPKRRRRCARGPSAAASEAAAVAGWAPPPTGPSERGEETRSWGRRGGDSLGSGPQSREPSPKETEEVSQGHGAPGGLPSASRPPLVGLGGCQELAASGGSAGSGPQLKGDSADKTGEVCQGSRELPSVTHQGLGWMHSGQELGPT